MRLIPEEIIRYASNYQIDSRNVGPGSLFFALPGERVDGHLFLEDVAKKGAFGAVVSRKYLGEDHGLALIYVDDVEQCLRAQAREVISRFQGPIIGVTGSVGKTTTKDFISALLVTRYRVAKTPLNHNTKLTLPLAILNKTGDHNVWILEMGMSEPGDLSRLLEVVSPDTALITKVALSHVAFFSDGL